MGSEEDCESKNFCMGWGLVLDYWGVISPRTIFLLITLSNSSSSWLKLFSNSAGYHCLEIKMDLYNDKVYKKYLWHLLQIFFLLIRLLGWKKTLTLLASESLQSLKLYPFHQSPVSLIPIQDPSQASGRSECQPHLTLAYKSLFLALSQLS